ncbi:cephalosporin hydroxylase family protein [Algoriphagus marincola]|uniref:Cephalosporin hydroxylase family protein n=1 Tax=Algoriphagus marincola TaxID=264027 RepID=A0ABS7N3E2_9BACT|nr:CmcI family methyltransferase [Algoriphagus marincola]MBY5950854.1 cephalosporin hydroxylase family protein [Algoriphagus marincola]
MFKRKKSFSLEEIDNGHYKVTYRGVPCVKCPFDYVLYQMIIEEVKPDLIIEIGTNKGGSALYLADLLEVRGKGQIHTIDITDESFEIVKSHPRINLFHNGWKDYDLNLAAGFSKILVIEDSSHSYRNTFDAINKFAPLVSKNSYLIVEDGIINDLGRAKEFGGGPEKAIREFLNNNSQFLICDKWINFFGKNATFNTMGYLKRIK